MQNNNMSRSEVREYCVHAVYSILIKDEMTVDSVNEILSEEYRLQFQEEDQLYQRTINEESDEYLHRVLELVVEHKEDLKSDIQAFAVGWSYRRISKIILSILYVSMCEIKYIPETPSEAVINEAVELAKKYDSKEASRFVNGILGNYLNKVRSNNG